MKRITLDLRVHRKRDAKDRWKSIQEHVARGHYKQSFLKDVTSAISKQERQKQQSWNLPENLLIDDDDSAGDMLAKIVGQQILKIRAGQAAQLKPPPPSSESNSKLKRPSITPSSPEQRAKVNEAFLHASRCIQFPLLDHAELVSTAASTSKHLQEHPENSIKAYAKNLASHFSRSHQDKVTASHSALKLQPEAMKELKRLVKEQLSAAKQQQQEQHLYGKEAEDPVYIHALARFFSDILKKRMTQLLAAGATYEDILEIFVGMVQAELRVQGVVAAGDVEDVICPRVEKLLDLMKQSVDAVCSEETALQVQRKMSRNAVQRAVAMGLEEDPQVHSTSTHVRIPSSQCGSGTNAKLKTLGNTSSSDIMQQCLAKALGITTETLEATVSSVKDSAFVESLDKEFQTRIASLEQDSTAATFLYAVPHAYQHWRKLEKRELLKHSARLHKLFLDQRQEDPTPAVSTENAASVSPKLPRAIRKPPKDARVRICVHIVEARNLAIKDAGGTSDPYCVLEYGSKQRYETEVVPHSLYPRWDQEITVDVKAASEKPLIITVWDKDEEDEEKPTFLSTKFWKEEADDFLGTIQFTVTDLLMDLRSTLSQRIDRWYPLEKRSKRSHISGEIRVAIELFQDYLSNEDLAALSKSNKSLHANVSSRATEKPAEKPVAVDLSLKAFPNAHHLYRWLMERLLHHDADTTGEYALTATSMAILKEIGERFRISTITQELYYLEWMTERYRNPDSDVTPTVKTITSLHERVTKLVQQAKWNVQQASGDILITAEEEQRHDTCLGEMIVLQKGQIQRYKDCFPCDTPNGALVSTLSFLENMSGREKGAIQATSMDSGIEVSQECIAAPKDFHSELLSILQTGTTERYHRIYELSAPMQGNQVQQLVNLADMIQEEIDTDLRYFQTPFAADVNIVSVTTSIYLKNFVLEMENLASLFAKSNKQATLILTDHVSDMFNLFYRVRDLQEKYLPRVEESSAGSLGKAFSLHAWFSPFVKLWLQHSEAKMLEWVDSAVKMDRFESIHADSGALHSTSVVDLFFCFHQMLECLQKLNWVDSGDYLPQLSTAERQQEQEHRQAQWSLFLTRFSRIVMKSVGKYCQLINDKLSEIHLKQTKSRSSRTHEEREKRFRAFIAEAKANSLSDMKSVAGKTVVSQFVRETTQACVCVNNIEAAREQLNELYDKMDVRNVADFMTGHAERKKHATLSQSGVEVMVEDPAVLSGYLNIWIVKAEDLIACDSNGSSDPYCLLFVQERSNSADTTFGRGHQRSLTAPHEENESNMKLGHRRQSSLPTLNKASTASGETKQYLEAPVSLPTLLSSKKPSFTGNELKSRQIAKTRTIPSKLNPRWDETFSCVLRNAVNLEVKVMDRDLFSADDQCGSSVITMETLKPVLSDLQSHDIWLDLDPQGKLLLRLQWDGDHGISGGADNLADIEYYFRKSFRELKRTYGDILGMIAETTGAVMERELVRIVKECEKKSHQGKRERGGLEQWFSSTKNIAHTAKVEVRDEEVDASMDPLTSHLNDILSTFSQHMMPRLAKELLRRVWKEFLQIVESLCVPSLFGPVIVLSPLSRSKPLTERQIMMLGKCVQVLKYFFFADGYEGGISMDALEGETYQEIQHMLDWYWKDAKVIEEHYCERLRMLMEPAPISVEAAQTAPKPKRKKRADGDGDGSSGGNQDTLDIFLQILRIRMQGDASIGKFLQQQMQERSRRLRWDPTVQ